MEKGLKTIKTITITLMVILLSVIAFCGTYAKQNNVWKETSPEFNYGIELGKIRELRYVLDTTEQEKTVYVDENGNIMGEVKKSEEATTEESEETTTSEETTEELEYKTEVRKIKANEDDVKTKENFEKTKKIIQKRLENEDVYEYNIRLDDITGELILEVPNDDNVSIAHTAVTSAGDFEIIDDQTGIVLIDRDDIKNVKDGMYQSDTGYQACLQIYFTDEGAEKLKNISNEYREVVNDAGETKTYYIAVNLDGQALARTYFAEELPNGLIQIPIGNATTDSETINLYLDEVRRMAHEINEEQLPIAYTIDSDSIVESKITNKDMQVAIIIFAIAVLAVSVVLIVKYKVKGLVASILGIGYIAILTIAVKYAGVYVTLNSTIAFVSMVILNYVFVKLLLSETEKNENIKETFLSTIKKYYLAIIPVCIIAVVFTFVANITISSIGMILFWGLLLQVLYNTITILGLGLI